MRECRKCRIRLDGPAGARLDRQGRQQAALRDLDGGLGDINIEGGPKNGGMFVAGGFLCRGKRIR